VTKDPRKSRPRPKPRGAPRPAPRPPPSEPPRAAPVPSPEDLDRERAEVEARIDSALRLSADPRAGVEAAEVLGDSASRLKERLGVEEGAAVERGTLDAAKDLLTSHFYLRQWGKLGMLSRSEEVDEFGLDPVFEARTRPWFDFLYERYWRVETTGLSNVPETGRCLLVANHSGTLPWDGAMIKHAVYREHAARREVRWLVEDFVFHFPFLGAFMTRVGGVRACPENAQRLLGQDRLVAVFPEGVKGIGKLFKDRYKLQRFGRGGYVKLVLRTGTPIVPVSVVGAEEIHPLLARGTLLARAMKLPYFPVTPTFPWLGPAGLVPAPTKWFIDFGEPIVLGEPPEAADDPMEVNRLSDVVRGTIQAMVDSRLRQRRGVFSG
jgi:1-acyl-sn-glycerol-3-phosphate acyltransferase